MRSLAVATTCFAILALSSQSFAQTPDTGVYYKLSTEFRGTGMPMDVFNGGPNNNQVRLDNDQDASGQYWRFVPEQGPNYRLKSEFRGSGMCLDVNPSTNRPELRDCGNFSGQFWRISADGNWVRLTTDFRGPGMCLDIDPTSNQPELRACGNFSGQHWTLARTNRPAK